MSDELAKFPASLRARYPAETEFHQAVTEVAKSIWPFIEKNPIAEAMLDQGVL